MTLAGANEVLLLHNPRCSKSRATKALLEENGIAFRERRYLEDPLDRTELRELATALDRPPRDWVRRGEAAWGAAGLGDDPAPEEVLAALERSPVLLERPIVVRGPIPGAGSEEAQETEARVGRPPAAVLELFPDS